MNPLWTRPRNFSAKRNNDMDTLTWTSHRTLMRPFHGLGVDLETVGLTKYVLEAIALAYPHRPIDPKLT